MERQGTYSFFGGPMHGERRVVPHDEHGNPPEFYSVAEREPKMSISTVAAALPNIPLKQVTYRYESFSNSYQVFTVSNKPANPN